MIGEFLGECEGDLFLLYTTGESVLGDNRGLGEVTRRREIGERVVGELEKEKELGRVLDVEFGLELILGLELDRLSRGEECSSPLMGKSLSPDTVKEKDRQYVNSHSLHSW